MRCMLDRDEDMMMTGTRHPFLMKYKVSFTNEGLITAAEAHLYSNCGHSTDLSPAVKILFRIFLIIKIISMELLITCNLFL